MRREGSKTEKFLSSFFFVLDWFKKADAFGYKKCSVTGQPRLNFHVWVIEHPKCPKGNRCARGPNTKSTHMATAQKQRLAATGMGSAGSKGKWGGLQSSLVAITQTKMRTAARSLVWITWFHLLVCIARGFWRKRIGCPHGNLPWVLDSNCEKVLIQTLLIWTSHAVLHCFQREDVPGVLLSFLWCGCPRLGTSHRCFTAKLSTVLHLTLLNSARDLQGDE